MNAQQVELYERIQAYALDRPGSQLSFSKRLSMDNAWSLDFAKRVIEEYKKFVFLAVAAGHPVTPSDQVDQAWHLHLTYTRSYWEDFCPQVLHMPLHHEPTRGGHSEQLKFDDWYSRTLESYRQFFGQTPPADIWPEPTIRFGQDLHFVRVNTKKKWLVPKPCLSVLSKIPRKQGLFALAIVTIVTGCEMSFAIPGPLNFTHSEALIIYLLVLVYFLLHVFSFRRNLRLPDIDPSQKPVSLNAYQLAYLASDDHRFVDTAIVSLAQKGYLTARPISRCLTLNDTVREFSHPIEAMVANAIATHKEIDKIRSALDSEKNSLREELIKHELLMNKRQSLKFHRYPAMLVLFFLGFVFLSRSWLGLPEESAIVSNTMIALCITAFFFWAGGTSLSLYGDHVLENIKAKMEASVVRHDDPQLPLAFAVLGLSCLPNDVYSRFIAVLKPLPSEGGGGGGCGGG